MSALTKDRATKQLGVPVPVEVVVGAVAADIIYSGSLVTINTAGYAEPAASGTQGKAVGVALEQVDNSAGSAGDKTVRVAFGGIWNFTMGSAINVLTDLGAPVFASDDQTLTLSPAGNQYVGRIFSAESTTSVFVAIEGFLNTKDSVTEPVALLAADGAVTIPRSGSKTFFITKAGVCAMTLAAPTSGTHDGVELTFIAKTANAHTLTATTIGVNEGNAGLDVGTFGGAIGDGCTLVAYAGEWYVKNNTNVTFA